MLVGLDGKIFDRINGDDNSIFKSVKLDSQRVPIHEAVTGKLEGGIDGSRTL